MTKWGNLAKKEVPTELVGTNRQPLAKAPLHPEAGLRRKKSPIAKLEELIKLIPDAELRSLVLQEIAKVSQEVEKLKTNKKFGLVFEEHRPEIVQLPGLPIKAGVNAVKRGSKNDEIYKVIAAENGSKFHIMRVPDGQEEIVSAKELVIIKKFGEPIYPTLIPLDRVTRAQDKTYHTIINADNFHALQLLLYCYEGQVDVIYIDPPYNTGARDWKYNNNYVDKNDQYRHSKWLSMMKKRLLLAKRLLKPDGVMICTIDEWEIFHLGCLMEEIFPNFDRTTIAIVHNDRGSKSNNFASTHEYAIYLIPANKSLIKKRKLEKEEQDEWKLRMWGANSLRTDRKGMFHPIYVEDGRVVGVGEMPPDDFHPKEAVYQDDKQLVFWPIDGDGIERRWRWKKAKILTEGNRLSVKEVNNRLELFIHGEERYYKTTWYASKYDASTHGSRLVNNILNGTKFPFPKSLYAVEDCIHSVCANRRNALILDFFAGSGTALHATCLLNAKDNGNRRCILVTNNEVSEQQANQCKKYGQFPGDPEFEKHGICESVTWPRCKYVVNGKRDDSTELSGTYMNGRQMKDGFEENLEYFKLDFLDPNEVAYGEKFEAILPILWLMAGAQGEREASRGYAKWFIPKNSPYAVLIKEEHFAEFKRELKKRQDITHVFLVTDSEEAFREMIAELSSSLKTKMLYKSYLDNFRINTEKNL